MSSIEDRIRELEAQRSNDYSTWWEQSDDITEHAYLTKLHLSRKMLNNCHARVAKFTQQRVWYISNDSNQFLYDGDNLVLFYDEELAVKWLADDRKIFFKELNFH